MCDVWEISNYWSQMSGEENCSNAKDCHKDFFDEKTVLNCTITKLETTRIRRIVYDF